MGSATTAPGPRRVAVRPTGRERTFGADELIVSKTDTRGVITYANDVFCRVGAYELHEVVGQPHNLIRHPAMPRAVFKLLWDTVSSGRELFAYVNNLAADGANYWVLAHVTPSFGPGGKIVGYHSNRRRPARAGVEAVQPLYRELLAEESRAGSGRAAAEAGAALLGRHLAERGVDYDEFIWSLIPEES
ncbi:PAS domain-containing protein [Paenibacillus sp. TRM 82003]|uniref:PAS domain-containing protein n=1 Tax=Kineococcus sp. TRM81007 TaxID=2925831 RepID=UPI001F574B48|nr:PAS domain-containing protein [Kineococcus sp. TRM81007]MCI2240506.1 PAS domain-containing protein [Kineococcus sp. TRM81007]MCI3925239.1 PAS domain-containing protein [Paenibacillus sp. TRM 82003]